MKKTLNSRLWAVVSLMILTVLWSALSSDFQLRVMLSLAGGGLLGLGMAYKLRFPNKSDCVNQEQLRKNIEESRRIIRDSQFGVYRRLMYGAAYPDPDFKEKLDVVDTLRSTISIVFCFGIASMFWFEPTIVEFKLTSGVHLQEAAKFIFFQTILVTLISGGFAGIFLNILFLINGRAPK